MVATKLAMNFRHQNPEPGQEITDFQCFANSAANTSTAQKAKVPYTGKPVSTALDQNGSPFAVSRFIDQNKAENLLEASFHAMTVGVPLNRFITIHLEQGGVRSRFQNAIGKFLKLASDWLRVQGCRTAYVWVRESGAGVGEHVHILLSVPPELARAFSYRQRGWLKACGVAFRKGVILSKPVGRTNRHAFMGVQWGECYAGHLARVVDYLLKGADPETRRRLSVSSAKPGGHIIGKRSATSQNIGRSVRKPSAVSPDSCGSLEPVPHCSRRSCLQWHDLRRTNDIKCVDFGEKAYLRPNSDVANPDATDRGKGDVGNHGGA